MLVKTILSCIIVINIILYGTSGDPQAGNYFLKAAKNVPRIGRSGNSKTPSLDEMGKFFMKASKSVPRIGRRNEESDEFAKYKKLPYDYNDNHLAEKRIDRINWVDLAERLEYEPELFSSPDFLSHLEDFGADSLNYNWEKERYKRNAKLNLDHKL